MNIRYFLLVFLFADYTLEQASGPESWQPPQFPTASKCGLKSNHLELILNGSPSRKGENPWLVALFYPKDGKLEYRCAGTLVSNKHVVTAAHCVNGNIDKRNLYVVFAKANIANFGPDTISRYAERIIVHRDFVNVSYGDVAVIKMDSPVTFDDLVKPICLWDEPNDLAHVVGETGTVAGWGGDEVGKSYVDQARQIVIPIVDEGTCLRSDFTFTSLTSNKTFCAGKRDGRIPCRGDSGGGFVMKRGGRWRLRGVVSSALSSNSEVAICDGNHYAVFTDVAKFETWLKNILSEVQEEPNTAKVENDGCIVPISKQMCEKWSEIESNSSLTGECGDFNSSAREFPHMAALGYNNSENQVVWSCGGSLISENFILTSGFCAFLSYLGQVKIVRLGDFNLKITTDDAKPKDYEVKRIIRHPEYTARTKYNNIALLELTNTVTFNDYIKPACLQLNEQVVGTNWILTGWGPFNEAYNYLKKSFLKEFTTEECNSHYPKALRLENGIIEKQICAGNVLCEGSPGSPLQVKNKFGSYNIIGVFSFGKVCATKPVNVIPEVFTRVSSHIDWIESIVWS